MRTIAFYFDSEQQAREVLATLRSDHGLHEDQVDVAPLVIEGQEGTILALSIRREVQPQIIQVAGREGGRLIADVPEEWTHPPRA